MSGRTARAHGGKARRLQHRRDAFGGHIGPKMRWSLRCDASSGPQVPHDAHAHRRCGRQTRSPIAMPLSPSRASTGTFFVPLRRLVSGDWFPGVDAMQCGYRAAMDLRGFVDTQRQFHGAGRCGRHGLLRPLETAARSVFVL